MAEVNVSIHPPIPVNNSYKIELVLNYKEAQALFSLSGQVTGRKDSSFRAVMNKIYDNFNALGVERSDAFDSSRLLFREYGDY